MVEEEEGEEEFLPFSEREIPAVDKYAIPDIFFTVILSSLIRIATLTTRPRSVGTKKQKYERVYRSKRDAKGI